MNKILEQSLLYDFYGELLSEHRRKIYEAFVFDDLSLGEIAEAEGISRQAVHDALKNCDKALAEYESKLHLVERFLKIKSEVTDIEKLASSEGDEKERLQKIGTIAESIMGEL
ncbi:MAG: YlxM family DNA-binding protein [Lachnospiraceae bacterium]|nr:YlxM family DNA-binding protein [Lachnospiraceae bacterium]